jgi:pimeloyl-ACP methyl ester carboxylesterase
MLEFLAQAIASIGVAFGHATTQSVEPTSCGQYKHIEYCYHAGDPKSQKVVYFMHGFGDDVKAWTINWVTGQIEERWKKDGTERPHIVTISEKVWWYTEKSQGQELTDFVNWFDSQLGFTPERRLYGDSMGGHNAFRWAADFPKLFSRMALICPAFPRSFVKNPAPSEGFPPWEFLAQTLISEYYKRSTAPVFNPLNPPQPYVDFVPRVHLIVSDRDDFAFYAGGEMLHEMLGQNTAIDSTYEVQSISHCKVEASQLAQFLSE